MEGTEGVEMEVDAVVDVVAAAEVVNDKSKLTNPKPLIHCQLFIVRGLCGVIYGLKLLGFFFTEGYIIYQRSREKLIP